MSDLQKDGGPAFPILPPTNSEFTGSANGYPYPDSGMSLRDYFAAAALTGMLSNQSFTDNKTLRRQTDGEHITANAAYIIADAMLKARSPS